MDDLVTWLQGVLDEDERMHARLAGSGMQGFEARDEEPWSHFGEPGRIAADIAAKRAVLDLAVAHTEVARGVTTLTRPSAIAAVDAVNLVVLHLASAYRDRHGYREEWAPDKG